MTSDVAMHLTTTELEAGLAHIEASPGDAGALELIVCRPAPGERGILARAELSTVDGLVGDNWRQRGSRHTVDGSALPEKQLNIINARVARLVAGDDERLRALSGDQLHVDLDLSPQNLPAGTRLHIGDAVIEITEPPHTGCAKFSARYGADALRFVNVGRGKELRMRGICAKVLVAGTIRQHDTVRVERE